MKLDTDNYEVVELTVDQVRDFFDDPESNDLADFETALDSAQGDVFSGAKTEAYVIVRITA